MGPAGLDSATGPINFHRKEKGMRLNHRIVVMALAVLGLTACSQERAPGVFTPDPVAPPPSLSRGLKKPSPPSAAPPTRTRVRRGLEVPR
jgi:hypothetical protein